MDPNESPMDLTDQCWKTERGIDYGWIISLCMEDINVKYNASL